MHSPLTNLQIYANRSQSQARRYHELPPPSPTATSPPAIGLQKADPIQQVQQIPEVERMRRGRPNAPGQQRTLAGHTPSPMRGAAADPFAALDSMNPEVRASAVDELSSKYPSLDEFSILHDKSSTFQFDKTKTAPAKAPKNDALQKRVTQALADDAFAQPSKPSSAPASKVSSEAPTGPSKVASAARLQSLPQEEQPPALPTRRAGPFDQKIPQAKSSMISTGVGSSPPASPYLHGNRAAEAKQQAVNRFPPRTSSHAARESSAQGLLDPKRPTMPDLHRSKSSITALTVPSLDVPKSPASSRPSLEGQRPSIDDLAGSEALSRSKSAHARSGPRPASVYVDKNLDYLRDRESGRLSATHRTTQSVSRDKSPVPEVAAVDSSDDDEGPINLDRKDSNTIQDNVDYLRAREAQTEHHHGPRAMKSVFGSKKDRRGSSGGSNSGHHKRSSLGAMGQGLAKTGEIMKGKFGDAFRKFEAGGGDRDNGLYDEPPASPGLEDDSDFHRHRHLLKNNRRDSSGERVRKSGEYGRRSHDKGHGRSSGEYERERTMSKERRVLTPIAGSEAPSSGPRSDLNDDFHDRDMDASFMEEQDLPPEVRRELERQRLAQEERRVEAAREAHRQRAAGERPGDNKSSTIPSRVTNLMDEAGGRSREPPRKTAEGYGRYNDEPRSNVNKALPPNPPQMQRAYQQASTPKPVPGIATTMGAPAPSWQADLQYAKPRNSLPTAPASAPPATAAAHATRSPATGVPAPANIITSPPAMMPANRVSTATTGPRPSAPPKPAGLRTPQRTGGPSLEQLLQRDLEGVADMPGKAEQQQPRLDQDAQQRWGAQRTGGPNAASPVGADVDWEEQFSKRYPSLSGIEMVEADFGSMKVRDV